MANEGYEHGIDWVQIDDDGGALGPLLNAAMPPDTVRASTLCYSRVGDRWWGCIVSNPATSTHQWVVIAAGGGGGGGGPGTKLLYVVGEVVATPGVNTPMGLLMGTFPNHEVAYAQAAADFAALGTPLNADFLTMPGTYPGYRLRPGMHVASVVDGGYENSPVPAAPSLDTPAITYTGPIEIRGSDGWVLGPTLPNASHSGGKSLGGAASCITIFADVTGGTVQVTDALLNVSTGIAINEIAGASGLTIQLSNVRTEALGATTFNGKQCRLQAFNTCRLFGAITTSVLEGLAFFDCVLVGAPVTATGSGVTPSGGSAHVRTYRTSFISIDGSPSVTLNNEALFFVEAGNAIQNSNPVSINGSGGTVLLAAGSFPGFLSAPTTIKFSTVTSGRSLATETNGVIDANGYVAPSGPGPVLLTVSHGVELYPLDLSAMDLNAKVDIRLFDVRTAMAWSELVLKRLDSRLDLTVTVFAAPLNEFDKNPLPVNRKPLPPNDSIRLVASREPAGVGRWLTAP